MMRFLNRENELGRLDSLVETGNGFAVIYGRRRVGKTRLLVEWVRRHGGVYFVADTAAPAQQRARLARAIAQNIDGFDTVEYPNWGVLLERFSREVRVGDRGLPIVLDELPYLVGGDPSLPSVLQRWIDHQALDAGLVLAIAGSSQRMMQGLVLDRDAPLFGRAHAVMRLEPLRPRLLPDALGSATPYTQIERYTAWGGVPRYWELAERAAGDVEAQIDRLVLDPLGPLHREPERLLLEEDPPAIELRALLDAIGAGAHRTSEIAGRIGRPATALARPLTRLAELGFIRREVPFGDPPRTSKRSRYTVDDPFLRLWFRVVAPSRGPLAQTDEAGRLTMLRPHWPGLVGAAWEALARSGVGNLETHDNPRISRSWGPAGRWWRGNAPEWDVVAETPDRDRLLVGEAKARTEPVGAREFEAMARRLAQKPLPTFGRETSRVDVVRALFVPAASNAPAESAGVVRVTAADLFGFELDLDRDR